MTEDPQERMPLKDIVMLCCAIVSAITVVGGMLLAIYSRTTRIGGRTIRTETSLR